MDKILAAQPIKVPTMLVHSLWDQEDIYGAIAVYKAIKPKDVNNNMVYITMGPWHHGQEIENGSSLGALDFDANTSKEFQKNILAPFLAHYLKDEHPPMDVAPVNAYETGHESLGATERVAQRLRQRLHDQADAALSRPGFRGWLFSARRRRPRFDTSPIRPSRFPSARGRSSRPATTRARPGRAGWSTTNASSRGAPMSFRTRRPSSPNR